MLWEYAIDAGSEEMRLVKRGDAGILREPSYTAVRAGRDTPFAWGERALKIKNRAPEGVKVYKLVKRGCPARADLFGVWARSVVDETTEVLTRKNVLFASSAFMREEEKEEIEKRLIDEGFQAVGTVKGILAAALGAGENIMDSECTLVCDVGAEQITMAVISGGRIVKSEAVPSGASVVPERLYESIRENLACAVSEESVMSMIRDWQAGTADEFEKSVFDYRTGFPAKKKISASFAAEAVMELSKTVLNALEKLLLFLPEELAGDITRKGITLTGGGARFSGMESYLKEKLNLPVRTAETPERCVSKGLLRILNSQKTYQALVEDEMEAVRRP